jgi:hypothetical protein
LIRILSKNNRELTPAQQGAAPDRLQPALLRSCLAASLQLLTAGELSLVLSLARGFDLRHNNDMRINGRKMRVILWVTLPAFAVLSVTGSGACAAELSPELPAGAQVKREEPSWGKEVNGLQLGISLDFLNRPYRIGEVAAFTFTVRNVGKRPIKLTYYKPDWSISPSVVDEKGKQLSLQQQALLFGPAYNIPVYSVTTIVAPKKTLEVARAWLTVGPPAKDEQNPVLDVVPGKYQVSYSYGFSQDSNENKSASLKSWVGRLSSGKAILQVASVKDRK